MDFYDILSSIFMFISGYFTCKIITIKNLMTFFNNLDNNTLEIIKSDIRRKNKSTLL